MKPTKSKLVSIVEGLPLTEILDDGPMNPNPNRGYDDQPPPGPDQGSGGGDNLEILKTALLELTDSMDQIPEEVLLDPQDIQAWAVAQGGPGDREQAAAVLASYMDGWADEFKQDAEEVFGTDVYRVMVALGHDHRDEGGNNF